MMTSFKYSVSLLLAVLFTAVLNAGNVEQIIRDSGLNYEARFRVMKHLRNGELIKEKAKIVQFFSSNAKCEPLSGSELATIKNGAGAKGVKRKM